ncbi:hypothetical protein [Radiobacillus sp. PE A8.2]|uniref:hypothetical protein n=1 Tax=Radiobacillus sp. PE A8.2 TaxID=3380349 RepID=UPI00388DE291
MGMFEDYDLDFEIGMLPLPFKDNDKLPVGVGKNNWAINSKNVMLEIQAANDFINWLHTSETGHDYIVNEFKFISALTNIEAEGLDPLTVFSFYVDDSEIYCSIGYLSKFNRVNVCIAGYVKVMYG